MVTVTVAHGGLDREVVSAASSHRHRHGGSACKVLHLEEPETKRQTQTISLD